MDTAVKFKKGDWAIRKPDAMETWPYGEGSFQIEYVHNAWEDGQKLYFTIDERREAFDSSYFTLDTYSEFQKAAPVDPLKEQVGGDHYKSLKIQPIEYIVGNNLGWCEGNIVKYITRWKQKGGAKDIDKVIHYAELLKNMEVAQ